MCGSQDKGNHVSFSIHTPLIESLPLSNICGTRVFAKMDALQPSGSFKMRGIGYAAQHYATQGAKRLISSSGGNAGLAVAYAGRTLGLPVLVVVPETTPQRAIDLLQQEKADVIVHGTSWVEANALAQSKRTETAAPPSRGVQGRCPASWEHPGPKPGVLGALAALNPGCL